MEMETFRATPDEIMQAADAFMFGRPDGWVFVAANVQGRRSVEAVFPKAYFAWRDPGEGWPGDFLGFDFNVPNTASATQHHLPLAIMGGVSLDDAGPDGLTYVLAEAVREQGARVVFVTDDGEKYFLPAEHHAH
jgi:hypothetical protein